MIVGFSETSVYSGLYTYILHGVPSLKTVIFIGINLKSWNLAQVLYSCNILAC